MPLNITKSDQPINVMSVKVLIYGPPGVGKTSTAFTAKNPLLLDFDNGSHRSAFRKGVVLINSWPEAADITEQDVNGYDTVIIDTVGRLLDYLSADLIKNNSKLGYNGALSLQGYGQLKARFSLWIKNLSTFGKDIVLISHDKEEKKGDIMLLRPDIQGSSYSEVFKVVDAAGYLHNPGSGPVMIFSPSDERIGKDCAGLGEITVPNFNAEPNFFYGVTEIIKKSLNDLSVEGKSIADAVSKYRESLSAVSTPDKMSSFLENINKEHNPVVQRQVKHIMNQHAKENGFTFDKSTMSFKKVENAA